MDKKPESKFKKFMSWDYSDLGDNIYLRNEIQANRSTSIAMFNSALIIIIAAILVKLRVFLIDEESIFFLGVIVVEFLVPAIICFVRKGRGSWVKYVLLIGFILGVTQLYIIVGATALLVMLFPLLVSCRYYNKKLFIVISTLTVVFALVGLLCGVLYGTLDLNAMIFSKDTTINVLAGEDPSDAIARAFGGNLWTTDVFNSMLIYSFLPNLLAFIVIFNIAYQSTVKGKQMADEEYAKIINTSRISSELNLATDIQGNMLPRIFPAFPEHDEFDIFASMEPAKEVGGDFYDFFMIDDTHVAIVIGDVSGKGVPAALFMVIAKTLIKDHAQLGLPPAEVFTRVNKILCESNEVGLFVTGWMGVLDISTGQFQYVNAGHNPPLLKRGNGEYEFLKSKPGFVLAGLDSLKYKQAETEMSVGDVIYLYTDGVTEATDIHNNMYGEERLQNLINANKEKPIREIVGTIRKDLKDFAGEAEQFDDITMLMLEYNQETDKDIKYLTIPATLENLPKAIEFVESNLNEAHASMKDVMQFNIAVEEIYVNIAHYAYPGRTGDAKLALKIKDNEITLSFKDSGIPFDPLSKDDPDITLSTEERQIGGLGIYMVKKSMDDVKYKYIDGMNVLTIKKKFKPE